MPSEDLFSSSSTYSGATQMSTHNPLEQFVLLAKNAKGAACMELIKQVLETSGVHVFGELLSMPNVIEVRFFLNTKYCIDILHNKFIFSWKRGPMQNIIIH